MTPRDLQRRREALGLTKAEFAHLVWLDGSSADDTVHRWETGQSRIPGSVKALLHLIDRIPRVRRILEDR